MARIIEQLACDTDRVFARRVHITFCPLSGAKMGAHLGRYASALVGLRLLPESDVNVIFFLRGTVATAGNFRALSIRDRAWVQAV